MFLIKFVCTYIQHFSTLGQPFKIKRAGIQITEQNQPEPIVVPDLLTLREMEEIDPYEFPKTGCRCTVTIIRLAETQSWWYPACNFCRKSCQQDGSSYICLECNTIDKYSTSFRYHCLNSQNYKVISIKHLLLIYFKISSHSKSISYYKIRYKLPFIASDGTEESEMIAFATVAHLAHRIVGKPVEAVMRSYRNRDNIPADIAAIVSSKFTFSVTMAEASYRNPKKSYQVNSIIHSYGKQRALPFHPPNQSQLVIQNANFYAQSSGSVLPSNTPKSSSESPILDTPTKMLPLEQFSLQTPAKTSELPPNTSEENTNTLSTTPPATKSSKKRHHMSEKDDEVDEEESPSETATLNRENVDEKSSDLQRYHEIHAVICSI
ncbi:hypothetical protein PVAP13_1NG225138 [Panicum virgatum]|uniref:Replication factor A C-terminal domain-containing protein n=1 Tax=Panicum virgatum TaxID=38727 RepID=A0A8T0WSF6_PANVG|nr:hypothetical protein PVAP13_1NG225138 [Panicum virgatum]